MAEELVKSIIASVSITIGGEVIQNLKYCEKCKTHHEWEYGRQLNTCEWNKIYKELTNGKYI